jgi:putative protease
LAHSSHFGPELLAPAGGPAALRAAVANGADAVYLGVDRLNARRGAENFTIDGLAETCRYAHLRGTRVYLTVNVVVLGHEFEGALGLVDEAWAAGVDAVIIQDFGLLSAVRGVLPHVRVHSSTQLNAHNTPTTRVLESLGVQRVTLAREVSIEEIAGMVSAGSIEVESFVHGALCVCYSGQCLMSSVIGRRSANRGLCAQPCRLAYELIDAAGNPITTPGKHLLSPRDLAGIAQLPRLVEAGVAALKIEGRMKNPEYVALVTGVYRAALDRAIADPGAFSVRDGEISVLAESFSRGFTEAYLVAERGNDMMSYRRPNNRGVLIGRVTDVAGGEATIALESELDAKDTIEFWTSTGRFAQAAGPLVFDGGEHATAPAGVRVIVRAEKTLAAGDRVFRVRNSALSAAARRTFDGSFAGPQIPLRFCVRAVEGLPLRVEVADQQGRAGAAQGAPVEAARTKPVTAQEIAEHIGRLGGTPYEVGSLELELTPNVGIGFSALHGARREALASYESAVLAPWAARERVHPRPPGLPRALPNSHSLEIVVEAADVEVARACLMAGADRALVPSHALHAGSVPDGIVPVIPRILHDREVASAMAFASPSQRLAVGNLGLVADAARAGANVEAHWSLNALNGWSVAALAGLGASTVWLSPELSGRQIADIGALAPVPVGLAVWGRQEIMVTEHCILMAEGDCEGRCGACDRRASARSLRDRKGYEFPVRTDITGRSHLYNSVRLDLTAALPEIIAANVSAVRLDVSTERPDDAAAAVSAMATACALALAGREPRATPRQEPTTSGHFFRGLT